MMSQESISDRLTELFDLYKSGALTQEEYASLKTSLITRDDITPAKEIIPPEVMEPIPELPVNEVISNPTQVAQKANVTNKLPQKSNRTMLKAALIVACLLLCIMTAVFAIYIRPNRQVADAAGPAETSSNIITPIPESKTVVWDEAIAKRTILDELSKYPDWSSQTNDESAKWSHEIVSISNINLYGKNLMVAVAFSNYEYNDCNACSGVMSIFEFSKHEDWNLGKKCIAFTSGGPAGAVPDKITIVGIAPDNYGLLIEETTGTMGEISVSKSLFAFVNGALKGIWGAGHLSYAGDGSSYNAALNLIKKEGGYSDIEYIETEISEDGNETITKTAYYFDGAQYIAAQNNNTAVIKRDPRAKDVANVFWDPEFTLFCKLTDEPIFPNSENNYDMWFSSHEEPYPHHGIFSKDELPGLLFYKFKDFETCKKWCDAKKQQ